MIQDQVTSTVLKYARSSPDNSDFKKYVIKKAKETAVKTSRSTLITF